MPGMPPLHKCMATEYIGNISAGPYILCNTLAELISNASGITFVT